MATEFDEYIKSKFGCVPFIPCNMASQIWDEAMNRGAAYARAANNKGTQPAHPPTPQGMEICPVTAITCQCGTVQVVCGKETSCHHKRVAGQTSPVA